MAAPRPRPLILFLLGCGSVNVLPSMKDEAAAAVDRPHAPQRDPSQKLQSDSTSRSAHAAAAPAAAARGPAAAAGGGGGEGEAVAGPAEEEPTGASRAYAAAVTREASRRWRAVIVGAVVYSAAILALLGSCLCGRPSSGVGVGEGRGGGGAVGGGAAASAASSRLLDLRFPGEAALLQGVRGGGDAGGAKVTKEDLASCNSGRRLGQGQTPFFLLLTFAAFGLVELTVILNLQGVFRQLFAAGCRLGLMPQEEC